MYLQGPVNTDILGNKDFVRDCNIGKNQLISDLTAASQFFAISVVGMEWGRGVRCLTSVSALHSI